MSSSYNTIRLLIFAMATLQLLEIAGVATCQVLPSQANEGLAAGSRALKQGDSKAAIKAFQEAVDLAPNFAPAYMNLGLAYYDGKDYPLAIKSLSRAAELDRTLEPAALFLGISYFQVGAPDYSVRPLRDALALRPEDPEVHRWLGRALLATGNYKQAALHLQKATEYFPNETLLQFSLGQAHMLLAQQIFDDLYKGNPRSPLMYFFLGKTFMDQDKLDVALPEFETALKLDPTFPGANEALADIYKKKGELNRSEDSLKKELVVNPYNHVATCKLGSLLSQLNRVDEAIPRLQNIVLLNPKLFCGQFELGHALLRKQKIAEAIQHLEAATSIDRNYGPAYFLLGQAYAKLGENDKSQSAFKLSRALQESKLQQVRDNLGAAQ
jgi:tetratricopeptide (TPR) repeat protein